jgi:putative transposase
MKRSKFSEEQIVYAIRQAEAGTPVGDLCRQLGVSDATFYAWKQKYAHLEAQASTSAALVSQTGEGQR